MDELPAASVELCKLFETCDRRKLGYIGRSEFRELCASFDIEDVDADAIFTDLDHDQDGRISFNDFQLGFRNFVQPSSVFSGEESKSSMPVNKRQFFKRRASEKAWKQITHRLGEANLRRFLCNSGERLYSLYEELQQSDTPPQLLSQYENLMECLMEDVGQLEQQQEKFNDLIRKEREQYQEHLKNLEDELEIQVQRVAVAAKQEAEAKCELEKRNLQLKLEAEITDLQTHLRLFQKVECWLNQGGHKEGAVRDQEEAWCQLDKAALENRQLKLSLADCQTTLALLQTELSQVKSHYEEKYRLLHSEKDAMYDLMNQQDRVHRQLDLLHQANRHLQDTNDTLRANLDVLTPRRSPLGQSVGLSRPASGLDLHMRAVQAGAISTEDDSGHESLIVNETNEVSVHDLPGPGSLQEELQSVYSSPFRPVQFYSTGSNRSESFGSISGRNPFDPTGAPDRTFKVVFAGDAAVGKSTFITRLHQGIFVTNTSATLGVDFKVKTLRVDERNIAVQLWDTAGQERFRSITRSYFRRADGVMLLFDVSNERSFLSVRHWLQCIQDCHDKIVPIILCGTKCDLRTGADQEGARCLNPSLAEKLAGEFQCAYLETSAKTGFNIMDALVSLSRQMITNQDLEVQTSVLRLTDNNSRFSCCSGGNKR